MWHRGGICGFKTSVGLAVAFVLCALPAVNAQEPDEEQPGLNAAFSSAGKRVTRSDTDLAFVWPSGTPDPRLAPGPFTGEWMGNLILKQEARYRFHAYLTGNVQVKIGDQLVLKGAANAPQWISGDEFPLSFGIQDFTVEYESSGGLAEFRLCWSSDLFPLEPLPVHHLLHFPEPDDVMVKTGQNQWEAFRCAACHESGQQPLAAPSLHAVGAGTHRDWLLTHLVRTAETAAGTEMPVVGLTHEDAEAVLAWLTEQAKPPKLLTWQAPEKLSNAVAEGKLLTKSLGCLACHLIDGTGNPTSFGGGKLDDVANRRTADWLLTWLTKPDTVNRSHRMPQFSLTKTEAAALVAALTQTGVKEKSTSSASPPGDDVLLHGEKLVRQLRCAACHELPGKKQPAIAQTRLKADRVIPGQGCLQPLADHQKGRPAFPQVNAEAIAAYVNSWPTGELNWSIAAQGEQLLHHKGCLACHDRDGEKGLSQFAAQVAKTDERLAGLTQQLIPPQLTAVGDRMRDEPLVTAMSGAPEKPRLDWLKVRMPRYVHTAEETAALKSFLIGHDRIPADAPETPVYPIDSTDPQTKLAGRELLGGTGFSCIACHSLRDYSPPKVALGTRGSNLFLLGERLRPEYYFRWTRSPLRVMPGVEMPSYQRPHPTFLKGHLNSQLAAIWDALHDPNLPPPTNPAVVEQFLAVGPNDAAQVVRDVFTAPGGKKGETIPRAFAMGFPNGQSILFDLDRPAVRAWTMGDFARQRTQGKSWFWDLAGVPIMTGAAESVELFIAKSLDDSPKPVEAELVSYRTDGSVISLDYRLQNEDSPGVLIRETWTGSADKNVLRRTLKVVSAANEEIVWLQTGILTPSQSTGAIAYSRPAMEVPGDGRSAIIEGILLKGGQADAAAVTVEYRLSITPQRAPLNPTAPLPVTVEAVTQVPGFVGTRLPLPRNIMPTALAWNAKQDLVFTSLKGHVFVAKDSDGDELADRLTAVETGLAAPFGILVDGDDLLVAHKPEVLRLIGAANGMPSVQRSVFATGWGYSDDYHDWTCGIVRDSQQNLFISLGSDYAHKNRPKSMSRWRGHVLQISPDGKIQPIANGLRYATGLVMTEDDQLFTSDQQGVQNTFNELNWIRKGHRYGVPAQLDPDKEAPADPSAVQIPHPWTRSVNGLCAVPRGKEWPLSQEFGGQILGAEYDNRFLIRLSVELVNGVMQGAAYPLCQPGSPGNPDHLTGPISIAIDSKGDLYVGSLYDSGWQGGLNTGDVTRLQRVGDLPNGIREVRVTPAGFVLEFLRPIDTTKGAQASQYQVSGYTRIWSGAYASPDSGRHTPVVESAKVSADGRRVELTMDGLKTGHVYELSCGEIGQGQALYPAVAHYTLHQIPRE